MKVKIETQNSIDKKYIDQLCHLKSENKFLRDRIVELENVIAELNDKACKYGKIKEVFDILSESEN